jgi:hypothetical protein
MKEQTFIPIYSYNKKGLQILWSKIRSQFSTSEETLEKIYRVYGKEQWESKCKAFGFSVNGSEKN